MTVNQYPYNNSELNISKVYVRNKLSGSKEKRHNECPLPLAYRSQLGPVKRPMTSRSHKYATGYYIFR